MVFLLVLTKDLIGMEVILMTHNSEMFSQLTNADTQGDYYSITLQAQKRFDFGVNFMFAYTHSRARDYGLEGGSQAISLWSSTVSTDRNDPDISFTRFDIPHRVIGALSYNIGKTTTVSLFMKASNRMF